MLQLKAGIRGIYTALQCGLQEKPQKYDDSQCAFDPGELEPNPDHNITCRLKCRSWVFIFLGRKQLSTHLPNSASGLEGSQQPEIEIVLHSLHTSLDFLY